MTEQQKSKGQMPLSALVSAKIRVDKTVLRIDFSHSEMADP